MASIYEGMGKDAAAFAVPVRGQMQHFALESVAVPSSTLLPSYLANAMLSLAADGTWTRETLLNVVGYQVWQFAEGAPGQGTEQLLQTLVERRPEDLELRFYLAELYHRRGDLDQAEANYRRVLEKAPGQPAAMARLGMVKDAVGGAPAAPAPVAAGCGPESDAADRAAAASLLGDTCFADRVEREPPSHQFESRWE